MNKHNRKSGISAPAVIAAAALLVLSCRPAGPVNWGSFDEQTIQKNLAALESAGDIYARELAAGNVDSAARQAQAALLSSPGVDTAGIAPDSSVWALFSNGLLAGTGEIWESGVDSTGGRSPAPGKVGISSGSEVAPRLTVVTPNTAEEPISGAMGVVADGFLHDIMRRPEATTYADAQVTRDAVRDLFASGPGVIYWVGHGILIRLPGVGPVSGLMLGTTYDTRAMAQAAAETLLEDLRPTGKDKRCALWWNQAAKRYDVILLPGFVREYADFDHVGSEALSLTKTMVCLTACFSAYGNPGDLVQAFLDKGADVVWGYDWAVQQRWSAFRDSSFFDNMTDTCFPFEAWRRQSNVCPESWGGGNASLQVYGDSLVRLQNVMRLKKDGQMYRAATAYGERAAGRSVVVGAVRLQPDAEHSEEAVSAGLEVHFPGSVPGHFNTAVDEAALVSWIDMKTSRVYFAARNYVGVGCQINVTKSTSDFINGNFSGAVGYWEVTQNPESVPPIQTLHLAGGCFKVTMIDTTQSPGSRRVAVSVPRR